MKPFRYRPLLAGFLLWGLLVLPVIRGGMESMMITHVLQMGLLATAGALLGRALGPIRPDELTGCNRFGITGTLLGLLTLALWLLPVSLDRARDHAL